jgi:HD-GYP domain-containing protein (c-di-GMP phosphodiesterase class II)
MPSNIALQPIPRRALALVVAGLGLPLAASVLLERRPGADIVLGTPADHFYIVSFVALLSMVFAIAVIVASRRLPDPRTFFLAMGFISMATIFAAHGLGTSPLFHQHSAPAGPSAGAFAAYGKPASPAVVETEEEEHAEHAAAATASAERAADATATARGIVVGYSAQLSLLVSAIFFALSVLNFGPRSTRFVLKYWAVLAAAFTAVLAGHVYVALWDPTLLSWIPVGSTSTSYVLAGTAISCFAFAGWRFWQAYRLAMLPLQGAMALGMAFLIEAQVFMIRGWLWHLSWWEYHAVMFAGFSLCVAGLLRQYRMTGDLGAVVEGLFLRQQVNSIRQGDPQALVALTAAVAAKDSETAEHIGRVGELVVAIGRHLGLAEERIEALSWAGRLHDVGKIGVPNSILRKPGKLTDAEFAVIKLHSPRGGAIALHSELLAAIAPIVRAHHERMDGRGYPDGLAGDEIPLEARIVAVADVWDALTCDRPYRAAMSHEEAAAILTRDAGPHLDVDCVDALFAVLGFEQRNQVRAAA